MPLPAHGWRALFVPAPDLDALLQLSRSYNGYVREEAVRRLALLDHGAALPALIERVNDSVPEVRGRARAALLRQIVANNVAAFVDNLPRVNQLRSRSRDDHGNLVGRIEKFVAANGKALVVAGIRSAQSDVARACIRLAIKYRLADTAELTRLGLAHPDALVQSEALGMLALLDGQAQYEMAALAIRHRSATVRRAALRLQLANGLSPDALEPFLFDRHRSIRAIAAYHLAALGIDVAARYRAALALAGANLRIVLRGLSEHGLPQDASLLRDWIDHPDAAVRREALTGYGRRAGLDAQSAVLGALSDSAIAVADEAARIAHSIKAEFSAAELLPLIGAAMCSRDLTRLCLAQRFSNQWERLILLLQISSAMPPLRAAAAARMGEWTRQTSNSYVRASAAQVETLQRQVRDTAVAAAVRSQGRAIADALGLIGVRLDA